MTQSWRRMGWLLIAMGATAVLRGLLDGVTSSLVAGVGLLMAGWWLRGRTG